ncbi:hypothetical protein RND81_06G151900 [Saponaria officinalis]|uniref:F-box domain-containing protein n=1 Tax=Saponaria officinalis TaxID=3572 RepID=A0AAW1KBW0_SAPOF
MRDKGNLDRISRLPDELLVNILSSLPTLSAVQTCILSSRWRHLFTLTRNLSIDDREYFGTASLAQSEERRMSFERFVDGVLALHGISPIHKFSLNLQRTSDFDCPHLPMWITAAILKGVQHLDLFIRIHPNTLPSCIFDCQTLTTLDIFANKGYDLSVPGLVCLPSLRTLKLQCINILDGDSVNRFFVGCSQLKELYLHACRFTTDHVCVSATELRTLSIFSCSGHLVIDAPNLANLLHVCMPPFLGVGVKNLRSLLSVELCHLWMSRPPQVLHDIIRGANNARELILNSNAVQLLTMVGDNSMPTYSKLEKLQLGYCYRDAWKYLMVWLGNSPQLETIILKKGLIIMKRGMEHELLSDVALPPFSTNVKTIKVHQFRGHKVELLLLKYLLENAGVLQRLILIKDATMEMNQELQVSKELALLPKASTYCTIELIEP